MEYIHLIDKEEDVIDIIIIPDHHYGSGTLVDFFSTFDPLLVLSIMKEDYRSTGKDKFKDCANQEKIR